MENLAIAVSARQDLEVNADPQSGSEPSEARDLQPAKDEDYPVLEDAPEDQGQPALVKTAGPPPSKLAVNARLAGVAAWGVAIYLAWQNASSRSTSPEATSEPSTIGFIAHSLDFLVQVTVPSLVAIYAIVLAANSLHQGEPRRGPALVGLGLAVAWLLYVGALTLWILFLSR